MSQHRFRISLLTVLILVVLRLALGCHFLYEGLWKIRPVEKFSTKHAEPFTAEPFLTQAKGPLAGFFYAMVPDINGRQRLRVEADDKGKKVINTDGIGARWDAIRQEFVDYYRPAPSADEAARTAHKELEQNAEKTYKESLNQLRDYFKENINEVAAYLGALDRFEKDPERDQTAPYQKQRRWDRMIELRGKGNSWSKNLDTWVQDIEAQELAYKNTLYSLLDQQQEKRGRVPASWNPLQWDQMEQINFAVTYGLTAIGACLILGLCSRLAALGGAAFMAFVVMTQPAFPGIYPPDPHIVGHALLVNKDFIEMLALLVIASVPAGRWGGLDFFLYRLVFHPLVTRKLRRER